MRAELAVAEERTAAQQIEIFEQKEKKSALQKEMRLDEREAEQIAQQVAQREQDQLLIEKYRRLDSAKIVQLTNEIERLSSERNDLQERLARSAKEVLAVQSEAQRVVRDIA